MIPVINKHKCPAHKDVCKVITACPPHAISYVEDANEPLDGRSSSLRHYAIYAGSVWRSAVGRP